MLHYSCVPDNSFAFENKLYIYCTIESIFGLQYLRDIDTDKNVGSPLGILL